MSRVSLLSALLAWALSVPAFAFTAKVVEVVYGDEPFAKLDNGEVRFLDGQKTMLRVGEAVETKNEGFSMKDSSYRPTVLKSGKGAQEIFDNMRSTKWRSQCYNRAHVWAYEEFRRTGTKLMKTFMFFTNSYIREYNYQWWFHVAPSTVVEEGGVKKDVVLDWTFFDQPEPLSNWTAHFIESKRSCPIVQKYSDYEDHQKTEDCYLIQTSMYFLQPLDIEAYEKTGEEKKEFFTYEVNRAYRNAL